MTIRPLTNAEVKNARAQEKDYTLFDGFGLVLFVAKSGGKSWRLRYVHPVTNKRQTFTIGKYPEFSLAEARAERERLRKLLARGIDPGEVKKEQKVENLKKYSQTVGTVAEDWLTMKNSSGIRLSTRLSNKTLVKNIVEIMGDRQIGSVKAVDVIQSLKPYEDRPNMRMRLISCINCVMDYGVNTGIIEQNNLIKIHKAFPPVKVTPFVALNKHRLPAFLKYWNAVDKSPLMILCLKFQIITMVRPMESVRAEWAEIDFDRALWTIPAERMKGKREHTVPLSGAALRLLTEAARWRRERFVFASLIRADVPISRGNLSRIIGSSPFRGEVMPHGFRAMASTILNEEGFHPDVIEAALAHKSGNAIRNIYNRTTYLDKRRVMMEWWGDFVEAAERGEILETSGDKGLRLVG
ncbi:integrase arm-type DNA-binding domain-containing protein [Rahnella sp. ChDrAdgB13]|uniref:tyrosine-type recombinase/integrase n=1 Tax=Rahnella sp. ChDrAdgB13 TaxID=1850581 RepID=UPI001AD87E95|nr:integrase arm-type DNA-binding domain-containing protein [Rahnella sp. ChDrAdgB13]